MAITPTYEHDNTFKKLNVNGSTYWLKDADLRGIVEGFGSAVYKDSTVTVTESGVDLVTSGAVFDYVKDAISGLEGAMHFRGVLVREGQETDAQVLAKVTDPEAGDVVIIQDNTKEYIYGGTAWEELGDQTIYLTIAAAEATYVPKTFTIAGIAMSQSSISAEALSDSSALNLKALAHKDTASGTVEVADDISDINVAVGGSYEVTAVDTVAVPLTYNEMDVTPAGEVTLTASVAAAATYDKTSSVDVTAAAPGSGETANYTPAGSVSLPSISAELSLASTSVATVTDAGTAYELSGGSVSQASDTTAKFVKKGVDFTVDTSNEELVLSYVADTDSTFYGEAVTAAGAVTYTAPTLSGALPTFGSQDVALTTSAEVTASYSGDATFTGTGVLIAATPSYTSEDATVTQPTYTATFSGTSATVTPSAATTSNALASGTVTISSSTQSITLNKKTVTVEVS